MSDVASNEFLRLIKGSFDLSSEVLRAFVDTKVVRLSYGCSFIRFLDTNKHEFYHQWQTDIPCCACTTFKKGTKSMDTQIFFKMYEFQNRITCNRQNNVEVYKECSRPYCLCKVIAVQTLTMDDLDISVLNFLAKYCRISNKNTESIVSIRNTLCHSWNTKHFSKSEYEDTWQLLENAVLSLVWEISPYYSKSISRDFQTTRENDVNIQEQFALIEKLKQITQNSSSEVKNHMQKLADDIKTAEASLLKEEIAGVKYTLSDEVVGVKSALKKEVGEVKLFVENKFQNAKSAFAYEMEKKRDYTSCVASKAIAENRRLFKSFKNEQDAKTDQLFGILGQLQEEIRSLSVKIDIRGSEDCLYVQQKKEMELDAMIKSNHLDEDRTILKLQQNVNNTQPGVLSVISVEKKCIMMKMTADPTVFINDESLKFAIDVLTEQIIAAGDIDTSTVQNLDITLTFKSDLSDDQRRVIYGMLKKYGTLSATRAYMCKPVLDDFQSENNLDHETKDEEEHEDYENIETIHLDSATATEHDYKISQSGVEIPVYLDLLDDSEETKEVGMEDYHDYEEVYNIYENIEDLKTGRKKPTMSSQLVPEIYEEYTEDLRIVLLGKTGSGKSATGNSLLGKKYFKSKLGAASVTKECVRVESNSYGRDIVVVDTPGLFDTKLSPVQIDEHIVSCVHLCFPGPHVFLIILQIGRFTQEEVSSLNQLFEIFGQSMSACSILLFTGLDNLEREGQTIEEYVKNSDDVLQKYISNCGGRYFAINNVDMTERNKENAVRKLFELMDDMIKSNSGRYFSNSLFQDVGNCLMGQINEIKEKEKLDNQKEVKTVQYEYENRLAEIKREKIAVDDKASIVQQQIKEIKSKQGSIEKIYHEIKTDMNNKMLNIHLASQQRLKKKLESVFKDNCRTLNSMFENLQDIDVELYNIRNEMAAEKNKANERLQKHLQMLELKLIKQRSKKVKKQSKYFLKLLNDSILCQKELTKKKTGICHVM